MTLHATHYHLPDRRPFLNLSDLAPDQQAVVMRELMELRAAGRQHRPFGPAYLAMRQRTEAHLRELFIARGGQPVRTAPHYFVLGNSPWYQHLAVGMRAIRIPLTAFPAHATSVTIPDSFIATADEPTGDPDIDRHHQHVYLLDELDDLLATTLIPTPDWRPEHATDWRAWPTATFAELQLWTDEPVARWLMTATGIDTQ